MRAWLPIFLLFTFHVPAGGQGFLKNTEVPLKEVMSAHHKPERMLWMHVDKSEGVLSVMSDSTLLKQFKVVFGGNPIDDKLREGDMCTPEGWFSVRAKYPHKSWSYFIWIDYPTRESWAKHKASKSKGDIPADASIGGEIGIHGVPGNRDDLIDENIHWTLGCVSLKTNDITEIYSICYTGMKIKIDP